MIKDLSSEQFSIQPVVVKVNQMPPLALVASKNFRYVSERNLVGKRHVMTQILKADKLQYDANCETLLDLSPQLTKYMLVLKHFSNKFNTKY